MKYNRILKGYLYTERGSLTNTHWLIRAEWIPQQLRDRAAAAPKIGNREPWSFKEEIKHFDSYAYTIHRTTRQFKYKSVIVVEYCCREIIPGEGFGRRWIRHYFQRRYIEMLDFFFPGFILTSTGINKMSFINYQGYRIGAIMPVKGVES